jgi:asparagine synthase (glutamine-hydrolysing)
MCGIAGFLGEGDGADLVAMTRALTHRGPDGEGFHIDEAHRVFLGHRRLAVIDLDGGKQPLWTDEGDIGVVFNGEIYNHGELRAELIAKGHRFRTDHSDTEVLVHGYREWGERLSERLNGMFAFAIIDCRKRRLFLVRDRFGEKPLYYTWRPGFFAFASELGALPHHSGIAAEPDVTAIQKFLAHGFFPGETAFYRGCRKLRGGHSLSVEFSAEYRPRPVAFYRFAIEPDPSLLERREEDLAEELRELLLQATRRRLAADVPLGVFLSGGIDSSLIAASAAKLQRPAEVRTFTIGFTEPSFDESTYARRVAKVIGTRHFEQVLDYTAAEKLVPKVLGRLTEPLGDPSLIPTFLLCRETRKHVTVALSGDGGDELFAGYDPFAALGPAALYSRLVPQAMHRGIRRLADFLPTSSRNMTLDFKLRRALGGLSYPAAMWNPVWMGPLAPDLFAEVFDVPLAADELFSEAIDLWEGSPHLDATDRTLEYFTTLYLQDDILAKVDRAGMMNSLESRAVFLDNDLTNFARRLPHKLKFRRGERKYLLRKAAEGLLPDEIIRRPKKGFGIPASKWLRTLPMPDAKMPAGVSAAHMSRVRADHVSGRHDDRLFLWSWLSLATSLGGHQQPTADKAAAPQLTACG